MASPLIHETVWLDKYKYDDAEKKWQEQIAKTPKTENEKQISHSSLVGEIARARQHIKNSLQSGESVNLVLPTETPNLSDRVQKLEAENEQLQKLYCDLQSLVQKLENRIVSLEGKPKPDQSMTPSSTPVKSPVKNKPEQDEDDDDIDLFGSGESEDESSKIREQRLKEYADKKSKKKAVIAKSSVVLDVKPWDDETNMKEMEIKVREIEMDGLKWGASKLVPLAYGIHKLQIGCVVEDEKVSIDLLQETIEEIKDYVQSVDIAAFNKL